MSRREFHLGLIQAVITRMGNNSFLLKGWTITLVSAIAAFAADKNKEFLMLLCLVPTIIFWALDGYYMNQEYLFRNLYDKQRLRSGDDSDYSMVTEPQSSSRGWLISMIRPTVSLFYVGLIITGVIVLVIIHTNQPITNKSTPPALKEKG